MEFAEHRAYVAGDDLRHLDWNAFARHEKLVVKEFESELERTVLLILDLSQSTDGLKRERVLQIAAALGWLALLGQDRLALATLGSSGRYHPPLRGQGQWGSLMRWLAECPAGGQAQLQVKLEELARRLPRSSLVVILSDWLEPDAEASFAALHYRKHQVAALQLLDSVDREPPWLGPLHLEDSETAEVRSLALDSTSLALYRAALESHQGRLRSQCRRRGFAFHSCSAETPLETLLLGELASQGWLA